ncbi:hypothetical protein D187_005879 [Cystobacter fuscus DSM 2262]|uniref:Uncharacterized protein n=1 Tax=Cystobacter fuscus (strain ATCC 25194 / DSM 2262 / NBRC 100088 / M29) TaxID=1242864 RepID=S9R3J9_CYSF2|nr:hypothetical protein D187_005879 [Cystobacter fuscus DSM 2262]
MGVNQQVGKRARLGWGWAGQGRLARWAAHAWKPELGFIGGLLVAGMSFVTLSLP